MGALVILGWECRGRTKKSAKGETRKEIRKKGQDMLQSDQRNLDGEESPW